MRYLLNGRPGSRSKVATQEVASTTEAEKSPVVVVLSSKEEEAKNLCVSNEELTETDTETVSESKKSSAVVEVNVCPRKSQ